MAVVVRRPEEIRAEIHAERERRARGEQLAEEAKRLSGSLRDYMRAAWPLIEPATRFRPNWHIDAIAEHLEAAYAREILRLLINIPPRTMKSSNVTVLAPTWRWTSAPHERFLTLSYGADLATRDAVKSRRLIASHWYAARWGHMFRLTSDQNAKTRYENDRTGYRIASSVGGLGTGEGGDVIIIDDPHKADEVESETQRASVIDWHDGTISTRFNDPATGVEIVVMQRLHEADLSGHLLSSGDWHHLCLPMEYEPTHPFVCPREITLSSGRVLPGDPRTEQGELLWEGRPLEWDHGKRRWRKAAADAARTAARFPRAAVDKLKRTLGSYRAAGQLQQRPAPAEGGILKRYWWRYYRPADRGDGTEDWSHLPRFDRLVQGWDTALKEKTTSDFTVGVLWGIAGGDRYLLREVRGQWGLPETKLQLELLYSWGRERWPAVGQAIYVGNSANGPEVVAQLRHRIPGIVPVPEGAGGDKVQRAHAASPQIEAGNVYLPGAAALQADGELGPDEALTPPWVQEFILEHSSFPNAAHDDRVDTTTLVLLRAGLPGGSAGDELDDKPEPTPAHSAGILERTF